MGNEEKRAALNSRIRRIQQAQKSAERGMSGRFDHNANLIFGSEEEDNNDDDQYSYAKVKKGSLHGKATLGDIRRDGIQESQMDLLEETNMESSEVYIYGEGGESKSVKIIDKSKRAFDISNDAVKSLELALQKPRGGCKYKWTRCRGWWYSLWILFFKHHGIPPKSGTRYQYFLGFAVFLALDTLLNLNLCFHMFQPLDNWKTLGIPFFFIAPAVTVIGPILGILACIFASPRMLKLQASANATAVLLNYPLTLAVMFVINDEPFYIAITILLWFNKICISFFGAKVRQHLINPGFCRNAEKIEELFNSYSQVKVMHDAGVKAGMSAEERAAQLASAGPPPAMSGADSDEEEDEEDEDDTSFGIIPKARLDPPTQEDDLNQF